MGARSTLECDSDCDTYVQYISFSLKNCVWTKAHPQCAFAKSDDSLKGEKCLPATVHCKAFTKMIDLTVFS